MTNTTSPVIGRMAVKFTLRRAMVLFTGAAATAVMLGVTGSTTGIVAALACFIAGAFAFALTVLTVLLVVPASFTPRARLLALKAGLTIALTAYAFIALANVLNNPVFFFMLTACLLSCAAVIALMIFGDRAQNRI